MHIKDAVKIMHKQADVYKHGNGEMYLFMSKALTTAISVSK